MPYLANIMVDRMSTHSKTMLALMIVWNHLPCTSHWLLTDFNNSLKDTCTMFR